MALVYITIKQRREAPDQSLLKIACHSGEYQNPSVNWHDVSVMDTGIRRYDGCIYRVFFLSLVSLVAT